jgi:hypothetical protein
MAAFVLGASILGPLTASLGRTAAAAVQGDLQKAITDGVQSVVTGNPQVQQLMGAASQVKQMSSGFTSGFVQGLGGKVEGTVRGYVDQQVTSRLGDLQGAVGSVAAATDDTIASLQGNALKPSGSNANTSNVNASGNPVNNSLPLDGGGFDLASIAAAAKQTLAGSPQIQQLVGSMGQIKELTSVVQPGFVQEKMGMAKNAVQGFADQQITSKLGQVQAATDAASARLSMTTADTIGALEANALQNSSVPAVNNSGNPISNDFNLQGGGELVLGPSKVPPSVANKSGPSPLPPHMQGGSRKRKARRSSRASRKRQHRSRKH